MFNYKTINSNLYLCKFVHVLGAFSSKKTKVQICMYISMYICMQYLVDLSKNNIYLKAEKK